MRKFGKVKYSGYVRALAVELLRDNIRRVYGIPKNGMFIAQSLEKHGIVACEHLSTAQAYVDDLVDSGQTKEKWLKKKKLPFYTLVEKKDNQYIQFWFEPNEGKEKAELLTRLKQIEEEEEDAN